MAFDFSKLNLGRANFNCDATSSNSAVHTYITPDLLSTIKTAGYFPAYLGYDEEAVKIGDILQVSSWYTGNAIQDELSFNFVILTVAPLAIVQLDQLLYNKYTVSYSGAASGNLTVGFSRDPSGLVSMQIITTAGFSTNAVNYITCAFTVPSQYLPDPNKYGSGGVTVGVATANTSVSPATPFSMDINVNATPNAGIKFSRMPNNLFAVGLLLPVHNYTVPYLGQPI